jgi:hypothetical protein
MSNRPSVIIESTIFQRPCWPRASRAGRGARVNVFLSAGDADLVVAVADACAASITAFRPEPHTALIVTAGCSAAARSDDRLARRVCPEPVASTRPRMTSPIWSPESGTPSRLAMTAAPSSGRRLGERAVEFADRGGQHIAMTMSVVMRCPLKGWTDRKLRLTAPSP